MKEAAKKGDRDVCIILAKEIIHSRKAISKIYTSKAHINSISMQMKNQLGWCLQNN
jgi:charged multivesicular body protein 3